MYDICREEVTFKIDKNETLENLDGCKRLLFNSAISSGIDNVDNGIAYLYESEVSKSIGTVVLVHGTGDKNFNPLRYYARQLSEKGYTVLMPVLPYHFERTPKGKKSGMSFVKGTDLELQARFEQAICDIFSCLDFLEKSGYKKISIMGISFGGMIATISMALDKRIDKGIFVVTGGNFKYITWNSVATKVLRVNYEENSECNINKCNEIHKCFNETYKNFRDKSQLKDMPCCFRYDSCIFANIIKPEKVLMFTALFDIFIPRKSSDDLWNKLKKPKRHLLFSGHLGSHVLYRKYILRKTLEFLKGTVQ